MQRERSLEALLDGGEIRADLLVRNARAPARDDTNVLVAAFVSPPLLERGRDPEVGALAHEAEWRVREADARRHHTDNRARAPGDRHRAVERRRVATEPAHPQRVAQHDHAWCAQDPISGLKATSQQRPRA